MESLTKAGLSFVVAAIIIATGAMILHSFQKNITDTNSTAFNIVTQGLESLSTLGAWMPLLAMVIVAGVVLAYIFGAFRGGIR